MKGSVTAMEALSALLLQLDEARRYIQDGRLGHLRLALVLLDNAVEVQMHRRIRYELAREDGNERIRSSILTNRESLDDLPPTLKVLVDREPLSNRKRKAIERDFNAKVDYLSERLSHLDKRFIVPLKRLHLYRNEAYHASIIRPETIRTASEILLDINCEMAISLPRTGYSHSSSGDYSWLRERFSLSEQEVWRSGWDITQKAIDDIRSEIALDDARIATLLDEHMESRIDELVWGLDFAVENTWIPDRETALKWSQYVGDRRRKDAQAAGVEFGDYRAKYDLADIDGIRRSAAGISSATDRVEAFSTFADLEAALESVEMDVDAMTSDIDEAIQLEIDIMRGK